VYAWKLSDQIETEKRRYYIRHCMDRARYSQNVLMHAGNDVAIDAGAVSKFSEINDVRVFCADEGAEGEDFVLGG